MGADHKEFWCRNEMTTETCIINVDAPWMLKELKRPRKGIRLPRLRNVVDVSRDSKFAGMQAIGGFWNLGLEK